MSTVYAQVYESLSPLAVELSVLLCFLLGFVFLRLDTFGKGHSRKKVDDNSTKAFDIKVQKTIENEAAEGNSAVVIRAWRAATQQAPTPVETLRLVVQAMLSDAGGSFDWGVEIVDHMSAHAEHLCTARAASCVLDIVARHGTEEDLDSFWHALQHDLGIFPTTPICEVLLGGYAARGCVKKVQQVVQLMEDKWFKPTARGYTLTIKGYLKNCLHDEVKEKILLMHEQGFTVPPFAVLQFFRIAVDEGKCVSSYRALSDAKVPLPGDALGVILEDCCRGNDLELAQEIDRQGAQLSTGGYDALLKMYTARGDPRALEIFQEMQTQDVRISEGLCVGLLTRCADTKFLRFAEEIVKYVRSKNSMSIAVYSALMKVYAYSGMYDRACDLHAKILEDGLEPDSMMYGCLMKFAVECGRTELSRELSEKAPCLEIQNYMSLIRAAGRDKDIGKAYAVLNRLKKSGVQMDVAAYNCVLDVCAAAGDMKQARALVEEMKATCSVDTITYNTLVKSYCNGGDIAGARAVLKEMAAAGHSPNDVTYNCLINAAVGHGRSKEAWELVEAMERSGTKIDCYTICIMMKGLRRCKGPHEVQRALALLDRSGLDLASDEIMLNTVLETCLRHREVRRVEAIIDMATSGRFRPSAHTYGSLIKACGSLGRKEAVWKLWTEMTNARALEPNDVVLGCMLDALVTNKQIDEAVELFYKYKDVVPPNAVLLSTLVKGFANAHQASRAMTLWREMRSAKVVLNTVVYNSVIDAQARVGAMRDLEELVRAMDEDGCQPDAITYSTIVKGYCVKGNLDAAYGFFKNMQKSKMAHDAVIYNTLLDGCTRHSRFDLADRLLEDMELNGIAPSNFTLGILAKMYGRRKQLDKAFEVVETLSSQYGFKPNAQVRTCLICACLGNGELDRAYRVFGELREAFQGADAKAYAALISGCVRFGEVMVAIRLVEEAYGLPETVGGPPQPRGLFHDQKLEMEPLEHLFRAVAAQGLGQTVGRQLLDRLQAANVHLSPRIYTTVSGCGAAAKGNSAGGRGPRGRA